MRLPAWIPLLAVLACPANAAADWNRSALPTSLRAQVHLNAGEVPPFPEPDSTRKNPTSWPPEFDAVGKHFALTIDARKGNDRTAPKTLANIPPGAAITLTYVNAQGPGDLLAGPSYQWDATGRLTQRTWYEPDTLQFRSSRYATYPSGHLKSYERSTRKQQPGPDDTLTVLTEYFEESGALAGFSYDRFGGGVKQSQWWWAGTPVSAREWEAYRKPYSN